MMESFIYQQYISDTSVCDDIIDEFKNFSGRRPGTSYKPSGEEFIDKSIKDSIDAPLLDNSQPYFDLLREVCNKYIELFPFCNHYSPFGIIENVNIQYYPPGGGFKTYHTERFYDQPPVSARHLVFMTYLNDVDDGGGTQFFHQNIIVQAKKGLTVMWPADWTYTHRGVVSPSQEKYIVTGWLSFTSE